MAFSAAGNADCSVPLASSSAVDASILRGLSRASRAEADTSIIIKDFIATAVLALGAGEEDIAEGEVFEEFLVSSEDKAEGKAIPLADECDPLSAEVQ